MEIKFVSSVLLDSLNFETYGIVGGENSYPCKSLKETLYHNRATSPVEKKVVNFLNVT